MVTIVVSIAILVYIVSIAVLCHNATPYQSSWDDIERGDKLDKR